MPRWPKSSLYVAEPERVAEDLVAHADAEDRDTGVEHPAQRVVGEGRGRRVTGAVADEDAVGAGRRAAPSAVERAGMTMRLDPELGEMPRACVA